MAYKPQGLAVVEGGTSLKTLTAHALYVGNGTSAPTALAVGVTGQTVLGQTGADPIWGALPTSPASGVVNLGITYAGGTFTVCSASGAALSAANPGYVTLQGKTPGIVKIIPVTANQTFTDGAAGTCDNQRFDVVTGINWSNDMPFFLYAVINDAETAVCFMISRNPAATISPAAASIGKTGAVVNVGQSDFFSLGDVTVADFESNPCLCIGAFRMRFVGATDSWTVQALSTADGIGRFHDATAFVFPSGQNGAAANTYWYANVGTEAQFTNNIVYYTIHKDGVCNIFYDLLQCNVVGVGASIVAIVVPYEAALGNNVVIARYLAAASNTAYLLLGTMNGFASYVQDFQFSGTATYITNAQFAVNDTFAISFAYQAFV